MPLSKQSVKDKFDYWSLGHNGIHHPQFSFNVIIFDSEYCASIMHISISLLEVRSKILTVNSTVDVYSPSGTSVFM